MNKPRLNRLLARDGRCFDVAIDHGFFGERPFLTGIEDAAAAVATVVDAGPDAVQLGPGQAPLLQAIPGPGKPALVLRVDVANVYGSELPERLFSHLVDGAVEHALRLDAACMCINLFQLEGAPEVHEACVRNVSRLVHEASPYGMPVMVEPLAMLRGGGGYAADTGLDAILPLVRQAVELGADVVKADPTDDLEAYHHVVEIAGDVPVLVRGGGRVSDEEILRRTASLLEQGARGIVYGRNVIQHENPAGMTRALMAIVHDGADPETALRHLGGAT
jgi:DhnA family fructose-bisphosphate aldolase class Ia